MSDDNKIFCFEELHLSAFLLSRQDVEFAGIRPTDRIKTKKFCFSGNGIEEHTLDFYNRRSSVEPLAFIDNIQRLRDLLRITINQKRGVK